MEKQHCFYVDEKKNRCFHLTAHEATKTAWTLHWQNQATHPGWTSITYPRRPALSSIKVPWFSEVSCKVGFDVQVVQSITSFFVELFGGVFHVYPFRNCLMLQKNLAMVTTISTPVIFSAPEPLVSHNQAQKVRLLRMDV